MKKILAVVLALSLVFTLGACSNNNQSSDSTVIKVGASPSPHAEILESIKPALEAQGYTLEIVEFTDYVIPNTSLDSNEIDANFFQHQPYLSDFNVKNGTNIVSAASIHFEPLGIYPGKSSDLANIADGASIGIPNDATNGGRALNLLQEQQLITLKSGVGLNATVNDIESNPKNLEIVELEAAQIPSNLPDVDFGIINGNYAIGAGIMDKVLVTEKNDSDSAKEFANVLAVLPENLESDKTKALVEALTSEDTRKFIEEKYGVAVVAVF